LHPALFNFNPFGVVGIDPKRTIGLLKSRRDDILVAPGFNPAYLNQTAPTRQATFNSDRIGCFGA